MPGTASGCSSTDSSYPIRFCGGGTSLEYRFQVQSNGRVVPATYTGIVPDTFKDEAEVVLKGTLRADGFHVEPNGVMAKCPSKYEPKKGAAPPIS